MAHEDRILSQAEIDSLLRKIMPKMDEPVSSGQPASVKQAGPSKPKEAILTGPVAASVKQTEPPKPKTAETPTTIRPAVAANQELASDEISSLKKNVADLSIEVGKLTIALQTITQLEERVKQLEAMIKLSPDSNGILKSRIDKISNILRILQEKKSDSAFFEEFTCSQCRSKGLVAIYVKCTSCGKENWMGWWPDENNK